MIVCLLRAEEVNSKHFIFKKKKRKTKSKRNNLCRDAENYKRHAANRSYIFSFVYFHSSKAKQETAKFSFLFDWKKQKKTETKMIARIFFFK